MGKGPHQRYLARGLPYHNLAEGLEEFLLQKRAALRAASAVPGEATEGVGDATPGPLTPSRPRRGQQRAAEASRQRHARLVEQYEAIRRLHAAGADVADIARRVGTSRRTVYRYRALPEPPAPKRPHRPPRQRVLTPYEPYLLQRWHEGCHNGMRLYARSARGATRTAPRMSCASWPRCGATRPSASRRGRAGARRPRRRRPPGTLPGSSSAG